MKRRILRMGLLACCIAVMLLVSAHAANPNPSVKVQKIDGLSYLVDKTTGEPVTGYVGAKEYPKGSGYYYYFANAEGRVYVHRWVRKGSYSWFAGAYGILKEGLTTLSTGKTYYFNPKTHRLKTGWVQVDDSWYYFSRSAVRAKRGVAVTGWKKLSGYYYYFDKSTCVMQTGWLTIGKRTYYLDPDTGHRAYGVWVIDGVEYDFGTKGYLLPVRHENGATYNDGATMKGDWFIKVNRTTNVVTVYRGSESNPVCAFICSVGLSGNTPTGTFYLPTGGKKRWGVLFGSNGHQYVYGQYTTTINGNILFHSVYYYTYGDNHTLATEEYNKLGSPASMGCVRMPVVGAKYVYDNIPYGARVTIFDGSASDDPLGKPTIEQITGSWDPTDPNP